MCTEFRDKGSNLWWYRTGKAISWKCDVISCCSTMGPAVEEVQNGRIQKKDVLKTDIQEVHTTVNLHMQKHICTPYTVESMSLYPPKFMVSSSQYIYIYIYIYVPANYIGLSDHYMFICSITYEKWHLRDFYMKEARVDMIVALKVIVDAYKLGEVLIQHIFSTLWLD